MSAVCSLVDSKTCVAPDDGTVKPTLGSEEHNTVKAYTDMAGVSSIALPSVPRHCVSHDNLNLLLPLPKHQATPRHKKYPLAPDDEALVKKLPSYRRYTWLDIDSGTDDECLKKSKEIEKSGVSSDDDLTSNFGKVKFKVTDTSTSINELRSFRKRIIVSDEETSNATNTVPVSQTGDSESEQTDSLDTNISDLRSCREDQRSSNSNNSLLKKSLEKHSLSTLKSISDLFCNFADIDILSKPLTSYISSSDDCRSCKLNDSLCVKGDFPRTDTDCDVFRVKTSTAQSESSHLRGIMRILNRSRCLTLPEHPRGGAVMPSLEDSSCNEHFMSTSLVQQDVVKELNTLCIPFRQTQVENVIDIYNDCNRDTSEEERQEWSRIMSVPYTELSTNVNNYNEEETNLLASSSLAHKLQSSLPYNVLLRSNGSLTLPYLRHLARQELTNRAVSQITKRSRRGVLSRVGGLLSAAGVERLGEADLVKMANTFLW